VSVKPTIAGATAEQNALLEEIFAGFGAGRIAHVSLRPFEERHEDFNEPLPGDHGDELVIECEPEDQRAHWEAQLLAQSFARRSKAGGLRKVTWCTYSQGGNRLENIPPSSGPLAASELERLRDDAGALVGEAGLESFQVLRPEGHAVALALRVEEPHAFLRFRGWDMLASVERWMQECDGVFVEIRDAEPEPVMVIGRHRKGGFRRSRNELNCCLPGLRRSLPGQRPTSLLCPVFGSEPRPLPHTSR
jgi:hypothetical protein